MRITRINETTVNIIITAEDMDEQGLSLEDFIGQTDTAMEFIRELMLKAAQEVDYKPHGNVMPMQVAGLPDRSISVTVYENPKTAVTDMLRGLADRLQTLLEDVQKRSEDGDAQDRVQEDKVLVPHSAKGAHFDARVDDTGVHHKTGQDFLRAPLEQYKEAVFSFDDMNNLNLFAAGVLGLSAGVHRSALYKDCAKGIFYLYFVPGQDKDALSRIFNQALEHGYFVSANELFILHLLEGADCLIAEDALAILGNM